MKLFLSRVLSGPSQADHTIIDNQGNLEYLRRFDLNFIDHQHSRGSRPDSRTATAELVKSCSSGGGRHIAMLPGSRSCQHLGQASQ